MSRKLEEIERSADLIDQAAQASALFLKSDIEAALAGLQPQRHPDFDGKHCVEAHCGVKLLKARLKDGRIRCVDCETLREARAKQFGKS